MLSYIIRKFADFMEKVSLMKIFNPDSPLMSFLSHIADLVILNVLWLVCCIPLVTIGASTTAMYHVLRHHQEDAVSSIVKDFFISFKSDFKQSTLVYLILLVPTAAVVANFLIILNPDNTEAVPSYVRILCMISALLLSLISSFSYPVMAYFDDSVFRTLRNIAVLTLARLPRAILITVINFLPIIVMFISVDFFLRTGIFWILIGGSLLASINMRILRPVFKKLIPEESAEPALSEAE